MSKEVKREIPMQKHFCIMSDIKYIRNAKGQIIAQERGNLIQQNGAVIARFNKGTNTTTNAKSEVVGFGDQRLTELGKKRKK